VLIAILGILGTYLMAPQIMPRALLPKLQRFLDRTSGVAERMHLAARGRRAEEILARDDVQNRLARTATYFSMLGFAGFALLWLVYEGQDLSVMAPVRTDLGWKFLVGIASFFVATSYVQFIVVPGYTRRLWYVGVILSPVLILGLLPLIAGIVAGGIVVAALFLSVIPLVWLSRVLAKGQLVMAEWSRSQGPERLLGYLGFLLAATSILLAVGTYEITSLYCNTQ
jgi:hypothetical protein